MEMQATKWKDIPQLELLFRIVLYHKTWPSGHSTFLQKMVSTATVRAAADKGYQSKLDARTKSIIYLLHIHHTHLVTRSQQEQHSKAVVEVLVSCSVVISATWDPRRCRALTGTQWWQKLRGWWSCHISEPSKMWMLQELGTESCCH